MLRFELPAKTWQESSPLDRSSTYYASRELRLHAIWTRINWLVEAVECIEAYLNRDDSYNEYMRQAKIVEQGAWE